MTWKLGLQKGGNFLENIWNFPEIVKIFWKRSTPLQHIGPPKYTGPSLQL